MYSFLALDDVLVAGMDRVQDILLQLRWDDDPIVSPQQTIVYGSIR